MLAKELFLQDKVDIGHFLHLAFEKGESSYQSHSAFETKAYVLRPWYHLDSCISLCVVDWDSEIGYY